MGGGALAAAEGSRNRPLALLDGGLLTAGSRCGLSSVLTTKGKDIIVTYMFVSQSKGNE